MSATVLLDGDGWQLRPCLGETWRWYVGAGRPMDEPGWVQARVPGSVLDDLQRAGEIPTPYFERQSLESEWVAARAIVYRRQLFTRPPGPGERAFLVFDAIDYSATVLLDGEQVGTHTGSFTRAVFEVTEALAEGGEHRLCVVISPAPPSEPQVGDSARVQVHKSRMGYGWDFCPRMIHQGIWQSVRLVVGQQPFFPHPLVRYDRDRHRASVVVPGAHSLSLARDDTVVAAEEGEQLVVDKPELWWPNGAGAQRRYRLVSRQGDHEITQLIGFRSLELFPNEGAPQGARGYTVVVNGRRLFICGWNWVPIDANYGVPRPAKLAHLLALASEAGVNLLRVWGGGLLETHAFYERCDELGLLVWQEFALSSSGMGSVPSAEPSFLEELRRDAEAIVPERRFHPSLALWCGGNELARSLPGRDDLPLDEREPALSVLADAVRRLDPDRPFLPTSPSGPRFLHRRDLIELDPVGQHDVHGPWEHQGLAEHNGLYDAGQCLLHSEVGVEAMTNRAAHEAVIAAAHRWPADRSNPVYEHLGAWWNNAPLVNESFGGRLGDLETMRRASQWLQYEGLRYAVEATRRRAPRASGIIPWQFNESFPNAWCTAAVDYFGNPKPAYYGVRRAYRPAHVCAAFATSAWDPRSTASAEVFAWGSAGEVIARFFDPHGNELAVRHFGHVPADDELPSRLGTIELAVRDAPPVFLLDLVLVRDGAQAVRNRYVMCAGATLAPLLELGEASVAASFDGEHLELAHLAGPAALGLVIEDRRAAGEDSWLVLEDNLVDLLPHERRILTSAARGEPPASLTISGWNTAPLMVPYVCAAAPEEQ